jgi:hypothetical protein
VPQRLRWKDENRTYPRSVARKTEAAPGGTVAREGNGRPDALAPRRLLRGGSKPGRRSRTAARARIVRASACTPSWRGDARAACGAQQSAPECD